jgi:hypothetical protein
MKVIWVKCEAEYFLRWGWTARLQNSPTGKSVGKASASYPSPLWGGWREAPQEQEQEGAPVAGTPNTER